MTWIQPRGVIANGRRRGRTPDDELSFDERQARRTEAAEAAKSPKKEQPR